MPECTEGMDSGEGRRGECRMGKGEIGTADYADYAENGV